MSYGMASFEQDTHVFVLRIWREPREIEGAPELWRGVIEHVGSGERRYLKDLNQITATVGSYVGSTSAGRGNICSKGEPS